MKKSKGSFKLFSHILILVLCVLIAVVATFSWYGRSTASAGMGNELRYTQTGKISGKGGEPQTFIGTDENNDGIIEYTPISDLNSALSITEPGAVHYFRTVITDSSTSTGDSMLSVYLENFSYSQAMGSAVKIGLTQPEKTYKSFTTTPSGGKYTIGSLELEDNIKLEQGGTVTIDWFIEVASSYAGNGSITLGTMHIVYN